MTNHLIALLHHPLALFMYILIITVTGQKLQQIISFLEHLLTHCALLCRSQLHLFIFQLQQRIWIE